MNSSLAEYYMYAGQCNQMLGQYEEALRILVHRLGDLSGAERFCTDESSFGAPRVPLPPASELLVVLLRVYLLPRHEMGGWLAGRHFDLLLLNPVRLSRGTLMLWST